MVGFPTTFSSDSTHAPVFGYQQKTTGAIFAVLVAFIFLWVAKESLSALVVYTI